MAKSPVYGRGRNRKHRAKRQKKIIHFTVQILT